MNSVISMITCFSLKSLNIIKKLDFLTHNFRYLFLNRIVHHLSKVLCVEKKQLSHYLISKNMIMSHLCFKLVTLNCENR